MLTPAKNIEDFSIEFHLDDRQRAVLSAYCRHEGFDIIQRIMEDEIKNFTRKLINTDAADDKAVLANHKMLKSLTQWYVGTMNRIKEELNLSDYNAAKLGTPDNPENHNAPDFN